MSRQLAVFSIAGALLLAFASSASASQTSKAIKAIKDSAEISKANDAKAGPLTEQAVGEVYDTCFPAIVAAGQGENSYDVTSGLANAYYRVQQQSVAGLNAENFAPTRSYMDSPWVGPIPMRMALAFDSSKQANYFLVNVGQSPAEFCSQVTAWQASGFSAAGKPKGLIDSDLLADGMASVVSSNLERVLPKVAPILKRRGVSYDTSAYFVMGFPSFGGCDSVKCKRIEDALWDMPFSMDFPAPDSLTYTDTGVTYPITLFLLDDAPLAYRLAVYREDRRTGMKKGKALCVATGRSIEGSAILPVKCEMGESVRNQLRKKSMNISVEIRYRQGEERGGSIFQSKKLPRKP